MLESPAAQSMSEFSPLLDRSSRADVHHSHEWDLALIIPNYNTGATSHGLPSLITKLHDNELTSFQYYSVKKEYIICKVRASVSRLTLHAQEMGYRMLLDEQRLKDAMESDPGTRNSNSLKLWSKNGQSTRNCLMISHDDDVSSIRPFQYLYVPLSDEGNEAKTLSLLACSDGLPHPFGPIQRLQLLLSIIKTDCGIDLDSLKAGGDILDFFPLHDELIVDNLADEWMGINVQPWQIPVDEIRNYFGDRLAFFYSQLGLYQCWLLGLALLGIIIYTFLHYSLHPSTEIFVLKAWCLLIPFWIGCVFIFWRRRCSFHALAWGTFESEEGVSYPSPSSTMEPWLWSTISLPFFPGQNWQLMERPPFEGKKSSSPVDGSTYLKRDLRQYYMSVALSLTVCTLLGLVGALIVIFINQTSAIIGLLLSNVFTGVFIVAAGDIFKDACQRLTANENHPTEGLYASSLVMKLFPLNALISYSPLVYTAFVKPYFNYDCTSVAAAKTVHQGVCRQELSWSLSIIFVTTNLVELGRIILIPLLNPKWTQFCRSLRRECKNFCDKYQLRGPSADDSVLPSIENVSLGYNNESINDGHRGDYPSTPEYSGDSSPLQSILSPMFFEPPSSSRTKPYTNRNEVTDELDATSLLSVDIEGTVISREIGLTTPQRQGYHYASPLNATLESLIERDKIEAKVEAERSALYEKMSKTERENTLEQIDQTTTLVDMQLGLYIQMGYVVLFSSAWLPITLLAYVANVIWIQVRPFLFLYRYKRLTPCSCGGKDAWSTVGAILVVLSVITNATFLSYYDNYPGHYDHVPASADKGFDSFSFTTYQYLVFSGLSLLFTTIAAVPAYIFIQMRRQRIVTSKIRDGTDKIGPLKDKLGEFVPPFTNILFQEDS
jgi:hypothetical protein